MTQLSLTVLKMARSNLSNHFRSLALFTLLIIISGCASNASRGPASEGSSNAHPASYLVDSFPVHREMPEHKNTNSVEFYFKKCEPAGERWPYARTSYDCNYP